MILFWQAVGPQRFKFNSIILFCGTHFYKTDTESMQYKLLRTKHIEKLLKIVIFALFLMLFCYGIAFATPIFEGIFQHSRVTPLALNLPFLEKDSLTEYLINMMIQLTMAFYSLCKSIAFEVGSCTVNNAIMIVPELIRFNLLEFQDELNTNGITPKLLAQLRNTLIQLQDFNRFDIILD